MLSSELVDEWIYEIQSQVMPEMRPIEGSARMSNALGLKSDRRLERGLTGNLSRLTEIGYFTAGAAIGDGDIDRVALVARPNFTSANRVIVGVDICVTTVEYND